ncbi:TetR family transcriptional regulator [Actinomadura flavalba]|uniref:acyl-CoA-like ligand-binding transcription factor n=1 Tax=Actinomadura flavalba TaxID=1120938 RepID=UPI00036A320F|nr:TetR family transcriptional regulator [Actinomadura flavalba]
MSTPPADPLTRLPLRERKKLRTRRSVQEHALRLFAEQGYDATTVEQIAAAAEISPSTFFRYFPTKEDVVVTDEYDPVMEHVLGEQPPDVPPLTAVRATLRQVLGELARQDTATIATRVRLLVEVPQLRARVMESLRGGTFLVLTRLLAERTGRRADDPLVATFCFAVLGVLVAALYDWLDGGATGDLPALVDERLAFLGAGMPL